MLSLPLISLIYCLFLAASGDSGEGSRVALSTASVPVALPPGLANPQKPVSNTHGP